MWRKRGLSLNHIAETLFASETFVKKAASRLNENNTRAMCDLPKGKSKKRKISGSWKSWPLKWVALCEDWLFISLLWMQITFAAEILIIRLARTWDSFKFIVGIFASKAAVYFQSDPTVHDENIGSIITHVCELNFTSLFNHAVVFVNAYFKLLCFNNYSKSTK